MGWHLGFVCVVTSYSEWNKRGLCIETKRWLSGAFQPFGTFLIYETQVKTLAWNKAAEQDCHQGFSFPIEVFGWMIMLELH